MSTVRMGTVPAFREFGYWLDRYRRTWRGTAVISVANPLLFVAAIGVGLGKLVDQHDSVYLHGVSYLAFMAPGLVAAAAMQIAYIESAGPVLQSARPGGNYRTAVAAPMRPSDVLAGHLLFIACRVALSAAAVIAVITATGVIGPAAAAELLPAAVLTGMAFATPVAAFAVTVDRPIVLNALFRFLIMPLYMFSGTFYPTAQLPAWLRGVVLFSPLWHGIQLCRSITLGTATAAGTAVHVAVLAALAVAGVLAASRTYTRQLSP
jgi:lipooligosaccharide transport system permease protein